MVRDIKNHRKAYLVLLMALVFLVLLYMRVWPNKIQQKVIAVFMGIFYFIWGVIVHKKNKHINSKVVLEYLAVATLGVALLLLILN